MRKMNFQSPLFPEKSEKKSYYIEEFGKLVLFLNCTIPRIVLIEFVLSEELLYMSLFCMVVQGKEI